MTGICGIFIIVILWHFSCFWWLFLIPLPFRWYLCWWILLLIMKRCKIFGHLWCRKDVMKSYTWYLSFCWSIYWLCSLQLYYGLLLEYDLDRYSGTPASGYSWSSKACPWEEAGTFLRILCTCSFIQLLYRTFYLYICSNSIFLHMPFWKHRL